MNESENGHIDPGKMNGQDASGGRYMLRSIFETGQWHLHYLGFCRGVSSGQANVQNISKDSRSILAVVLYLFVGAPHDVQASTLPKR